MSSVNTVKTRFLILSDTHSTLPQASTSTAPYRSPLPAADVAIHSGDLTSTGKILEHEKAVQLLKSLQAELKIVIPGNHDLTLDEAYCRTHPRLHTWRVKHTPEDLKEAKDLYTNQATRNAGIVYLEEGIQTFELRNGATFTVYASAYTPEFYDWAFPYPREVDRFNSPTAPNPIPNYDPEKLRGNIDVLITHGPPLGVLDETTRGLAVGCEHLMKAVQRSKPLLHCFGHIHEGWGAIRKEWSDDPDVVTTGRELPLEGFEEDKIETDMGGYVNATSLSRGKETLFVNASIMTVRYKPIQAPWIVDLNLPSKSTAA